MSPDPTRGLNALHRGTVCFAHCCSEFFCNYCTSKYSYDTWPDHSQIASSDPVVYAQACIMVILLVSLVLHSEMFRQ